MIETWVVSRVFIRALNPFPRVLPSSPNHPQRPHLLMTSPLWGRISTCDFGGHKHSAQSSPSIPVCPSGWMTAEHARNGYRVKWSWQSKLRENKGMFDLFLNHWQLRLNLIKFQWRDQVSTLRSTASQTLMCTRSTWREWVMNWRFPFGRSEVGNAAIRF